MRKMAISAALAVFLLVLFPAASSAEPLLVPVGQTVGLQLRDNTVTIAAFDDALGNAAKNAGLKIGDMIVKVNGKNVHSIEQIRSNLDSSKDTATLLIRRGSKEMEIPVVITPTDTGGKLGV